MNQFWLRSESTGVCPVSGTCISVTLGERFISRIVGASSASESMPWMRNTGQRIFAHSRHWSRLSCASARKACSARTSWR